MLRTGFVVVLATAILGLTASAASAALTPGWECIPTTAGQAVVSGGTGAAPSCGSGTSAVLAPTYIASGVGGKPTVEFSAVNVQVVSGSGSTSGAVNGKGNLIVGYAEAITNRPQTGSNDLVVGSDNSWTSYGQIVGGFENQATGQYATTAGINNRATGAYSLTGGETNIAKGGAASATGGAHNTAQGAQSSVSGGEFNLASDPLAGVSGGCKNVAGSAATLSGNCPSTGSEAILGGFENTASGTESTVSGGEVGDASGGVASIAGGQFNTAHGAAAAVAGGDENSANGNFASILGGFGNTAPATCQAIPAAPGSCP
jgi:hypothetical protein